MRRDLILGAVASLLIHGGLGWLGQSYRPVHPVVAPLPPVTPINIIVPPVDPDPDPVDPDATKDSHTAVSPPDIPDVPQPADPGDIIQPVQPPVPPDVPIDPNARIIPTITLRPGPNAPIYDPRMLDRQPVATVRISPVYPFEARHQGLSGTVNVDFVVDARGNVLQPCATEDSPAPFREAAVTAVGHWRFRPGMKGGRAVATRMTVPIVFTLNSDD